MPDAPQYGGPQVKLESLSAPLQNPNVVSADTAVAQGVQAAALSVVNTEEKIARAAKEKGDQTIVLDRLNGFAKKKNELMYDPDKGALSQTGENALKAPEDFSKGWQSARDEFESTLTTPEQKDMFRSAVDHQYGGAQAQVMGHVAGQQAKLHNDTFNASIQNTRDDGILQLDHAVQTGDPKQIAAAQAAIEDGLKIQRATRAHLAGEQGTDPQTLRLMHEADTSDTYAGATDALVQAGNFQAASAYYDSHKDQMTPKVRDQLGRVVADGKSRADAQAQAEAIYHPDLTLEQMNTKADGITDQKVQALTKERLAVKVAQHKDAAEQVNKGLFDDGLKILNTDPRGFDAIPQATLTRLNEQDPQRYDALKQRAARDAKGENVTTPEGAALLYKFRSALSGADGEEARNAAIKEDPNRLVGVISRADLDRLHEWHDKAKLGKDTSTDHAFEEVTRATLSGSGYTKVDPVNHDGSFNLEANAFRTALSNRMEIDKAAGVKIDHAYLQKAANQLMAPTIDPTGATNWAFGLGGPAMIPRFMVGVDRKHPETALGGGPQTAATVLTLSDFSQEQIDAERKAGRAHDVAPTDDIVLRILRAKAASGSVRPGSSPFVPNKADSFDAGAGGWSTLMPYMGAP